jgi:acetylornithine deacetylase/succinyl-diaminopimelate desuccinylase-like protein
MIVSTVSALFFCAVQISTAQNVSQTIFQTQSTWPQFAVSTKILPQQPSDELRSMLLQIDPLRVQHIIEKLVSFGTRHTLSTQDSPTRGIGAARDWINAEMQSYAARSGGRMTVEIQSFTQQPVSRVPQPVIISNVIAKLGGETAERVYVVSGHYDSMNSDVMDGNADAPGANDDASGVAVVLELCRIMADKKPKATILFAAVAGEEQGLLGSAYMAKTLKQQGVNVEAMLNNDIVGSSTGPGGQKDPYTIRIFAQGIPTTLSAAQTQAYLRIGAENDSPTRQLARFVNDVASNDATQMNVQVIYRLDRYGRGGDHSSFLQQGYSAVRFTEPIEDFVHQHQNVRVQGGTQYGDLPQFCDFEYIARVAKVNMAALWNLAMSPGAVLRVRIEAAGMTNESKISWAGPRESDVLGYEIVWRSTTSAVWTNAMHVGDATSATVPVSKDNVILGVRAIGTNGHRGTVTAAST